MKTTFYLPGALLVVTVFASISNLQSQVLDSTFRSPKLIRSAQVQYVLPAPDGKVYIGGDITLYNGKPAKNVVRLKADGTLDKSFNYPFSSWLFKAAVYANGLVGTNNATELVRLAHNGSILRRTFLPADAFPNALLVLPDGRILVSTHNGGLYCYKPNLQLDTAFGNSATFANGVINDMKVQGDKIILAGSFSEISGVPKNDIARINLNGSVDTTFDAGTGTDDWIGGVQVQEDNKILIDKSALTFFNQQPVTGLLRLNSNGSIDETFNTGSIAVPHQLFPVGDKIIVASTYNITRINSDGSADSTFNVVNKYAFTHAFSVSPNREIIACNLFEEEFHYGIRKYDPDGNPVTGYDPPLGRRGLIKSVTRQGHKLIVAGDFFKINNVSTHDVARLRHDGTVDRGFIHLNNYDAIEYVKAVSGRKIMIASSTVHLVRLNSDGSRDLTFNLNPSDFNAVFPIRAVQVQPDEKIFIASAFGLGRLNTDGASDPTFNTGAGICCGYHFDPDFDYQSDGKIVYGAVTVSSYNNTSVPGFFRLNTDGALDTTFNAGSGFNDWSGLLDVEVLHNDDVIFSGISITDYNGFPVTDNVVKVKKDGSIDTVFQNNFATNYNVYVALRAREFRDKIVLMQFNGEGVMPLQFVNHDGTPATDIQLPVSISATWGDFDVYAPDDNTLYVMGDIYTTDSPNEALPLVRINYGPQETQRQSATELWAVYPNPAADYISVNAADADVAVRSLDGQLKLQSHVAHHGEKIDVSALQRGRYIVTVTLQNNTYTSTLIRE